MNKRSKGFSLLELSIVITIVGTLIAGIVASGRFIRESRLKSARALTESSGVSSIDGLIFWLDATAKDVLVNTNNSTKISDQDIIKTWKDINPSNKKFTFSEIISGGGPVYTLNGINNLPTLYFKSTVTGEGYGAGDCLYTDYSATLNQPQFTLFIVTKPKLQTNASTWGAIVSSLFSTGTAGGFIVYKSTWSANTNVAEFDSGNGPLWNYMFTENMPIDRTWLITAKMTGPTTTDYRYIYINGMIKNSNTGGISIANNGTGGDNGNIFSLGCYSSSSRFYDGQTSEVIMFDRALNDEERTTVEKYLAKKYAVKLQ